MLNRSRREFGGELMQLPDWCEAYFGPVARRLSDLAEGFDYRDAPRPFGEGPATREGFQRALARGRTVTSGTAETLVAHALGLTQGAWSAFAVALAERAYATEAPEVAAFRSIAAMALSVGLDGVLDSCSVPPAPRQLARKRATSSPPTAGSASKPR